VKGPRPQDSETLLFAQYRAVRMAEERGWSTRTLGAVTGGLRRVLAGHDGGRVAASTATGLLTSAHSRIPVLEVLDDLELLEDDRDVSTRAWIERRSAELPVGFRDDVHDWLVWLLDGDARTRPRTRTTVHVHFGQARPVLLAWGAGHDRLRQITRADVQEALNQLQGQRCYNTATRSSHRCSTRSLPKWGSRSCSVASACRG
jgi:hypothetical protein